MHLAARRLLDTVPREARIASPLVQLELLSVTARKAADALPEEVEALVEYSLRETGVRVLQLDWHSLIASAMEFAPLLRLRSLDLLHVTAAYILDADEIITLDKDIIRKSALIEKHLGLKTRGASD